MRVSTSLYSIFLALVLFSTISVGAERKISVSLSEDNLLTVKAEDIPLEEVLAEIAELTSIEISLNGVATDPIRIEFSNLSLEKGIKRLTRDFNSVFIYGPGNDGKGVAVIKEIIIYAKGNGDALKRATVMDSRMGVRKQQKPPLPSGSDAVRGDDGVDGQEGESPLAGSEDVGLWQKDLSTERDENAGAGKKIDSLRNLEDERALAPLITALGDENESVRKSAADFLSKIGGEKVRRAMEDCLLDPNDEVRREAVEVLKRLNASESAK